MFLPCLNKVGIYVVYACYFSKLTFPSEFDSCLGGLGNLKLAMVGWGGCGPMWKVRNLNRRVTSFQRNLRGSSRYGVETSSYLKNSVFSVEILDTSGSNSTSHPSKFQNARPTQVWFKFSTPGGLLCQIVYSPSTEDSQIPVGCPVGLGVDEASNRYMGA